MDSDFQSVVPNPAASASPGSLSETHSHPPTCGISNPEGEVSQLCLNKPSRDADAWERSATPSVALGPATLASLGTMVEMQSPRPQLGPTESESSFPQDPQGVACILTLAKRSLIAG